MLASAMLACPKAVTVMSREGSGLVVVAETVVGVYKLLTPGHVPSFELFAREEWMEVAFAGYASRGPRAFCPQDIDLGFPR